MADRDALLALAERCEQATESSRMFDAEIWDATAKGVDRLTHAFKLISAGYVVSQLPEYTASLDAAMTLVPEGWRWWKAGDGRTGGSRMVVTDTADDGRFTVLGECSCPETIDRNALALTAAALRARAANA